MATKDHMHTHLDNETKHHAAYLATALESLQAFMEARNDSELDETTEDVLSCYSRLLAAYRRMDGH